MKRDLGDGPEDPAQVELAWRNFRAGVLVGVAASGVSVGVVAAALEWMGFVCR